MHINFFKKEVSCKLVYYGPGMSGKTTNLQQINDKTPAGLRSNLTSIATEGERTLFFDYMPLNLGKVGGLNTKFQLYTVPGQVYYNSTRKLVLQGVDGVVFVADSRKDKLSDNKESLQNLMENLAEYGVKIIKDVPLVIQWNKRDMPDAADTGFLEENINTMGVPTTEAVAALGDGVIETLKLIASMVLETLNKRQVRSPDEKAPEKTPKNHRSVKPEKQLAIINDIKINELYLKNYYRVQARFDNSGEPEPFENLARDKKKSYLNRLVNHYLMIQESKRKGIAAPRGEINMHLDAYQKRFGSEEKYAAYLAKKKLKKEDVKNEIAKKIIINRMIRALIPDFMAKIRVTEQEVKEYYKTNSSHLQGEFEDVSDKLKVRIKKQKQAGLEREIINMLRNQCRLTIQEDNL